MTICVTIRRRVQDKEIASRLAPLIVKLRSMAAVQPGYITDQTFSSLDREGEYLVISTWNELEDWNKWMHSEVRQSIQNQIDECTGEKTEYRYYETIVGGIIPRFEAVM